jgi:hypothetical protein
MKIQNATGNGLVILQPTKSEDLEYVNDVATPFNGEGCLLYLNAESTISVKLLEDDDFRDVAFPQGFTVAQIKEVSNLTGDHTNIEFAAQ